MLAERWAEKVKQDWNKLQQAGRFSKNRKVVLAAVTTGGRALEWASLGLKGDKEVVLAAVKQNGKALRFASDDMKADKEVVLAAVEQNGLALDYASRICGPTKRWCSLQ